MNKNWILVGIAVVMAVARFFMPTHPLSLVGTYTAFAHLFLGGLAGAWIVSKDWFYLMLGIALTLVELTAFSLLK